MGGECLWYSWTCRPVWPVLIILATVPCILDCSESPAAVVGKMYPRGNHWAVGKETVTQSAKKVFRAGKLILLFVLCIWRLYRKVRRTVHSSKQILILIIAYLLQL